MKNENALRKEELLINEKEMKRKISIFDFLDYSSSIDMPVIKIDDLIDEKQELTNEPKEESKDSNEEFNINTTEEIKLVKNETFNNAEYKEIKLTLYDLDNLTKSQALVFADKVVDEAHRFWTRKNVIKSVLLSIDRENAYSFIKSMINISETRTPLGDIKKYITLNELKHLIFSFLKEAEDVDFKNTYQYKQLKREYDSLVIKWSKHPNGKANNKLVSSINSKIEALFERMTRKG